MDPNGLEQNVRDNVMARNRLVQDSTMDWRVVFDELLVVGERLRPWVRDVSLMLAEAMRGGQRILFEGAQGTLLDVDHGTYPMSLHQRDHRRGLHWPGCRAAGYRRRMGVVKAYTTRVGKGCYDGAVRREGESPGDSRNSMACDGATGGGAAGRRRGGAIQRAKTGPTPRPHETDALDGPDHIDIRSLPIRAPTEFLSDRSSGWVRASTKRCRAGHCPPRRAPLEDLPGRRGHIARLEGSGVRAALVSTGSGADILRPDILDCRSVPFRQTKGSD